MNGNKRLSHKDINIPRVRSALVYAQTVSHKYMLKDLSSELRIPLPTIYGIIGGERKSLTVRTVSNIVSELEIALDEIALTEEAKNLIVEYSLADKIESSEPVNLGSLNKLYLAQETGKILDERSNNHVDLSARLTDSQLETINILCEDDTEKMSDLVTIAISKFLKDLPFKM